MSRAQQVDVLWSGIRTSTGAAVSGAKVYTYYSGTTTPVSLYTAADKSTPATNPIIADSAGKAEVWADGAYKFVITDADGVSIDTIDGLYYGLPDEESVYCGTSSGTNTITVNPSPALSAYSNGQVLTFVAGGTNTGTTTLNVSSLGAKTIKTGGGSNLSAGDITLGNVISVTYDSSNGWFVLNTSNIFTTITVSGAGTFGSVNTATVTHTASQTIGPSGGATYLRLKASNTDYWDINTSGDLIPVSNSNSNKIGSATYPVKVGYVTQTVSPEVISPSGATFYFGYAEGDWFVNSSGYLCPNGSSKGATSKDIGFDSSPGQNVNTFRVRDIYISQSIRSGANTFYFGTGTGDWFVSEVTHAMQPGTTGYNFGSASKRIGEAFINKINCGETWSASNSYGNVRTFTASLPTISGSDTVSASAIQLAILDLYKILATLINDTVQ